MKGAQPGLKVTKTKDGLTWDLYRVNYGRRVRCGGMKTEDPPTGDERLALELMIELERAGLVAQEN